MQINLSNNIYNHRTLKNWSQTELADLLGVSRQSVSKWENGTSIPDLDKLIKMKELYGVSLDELVFGQSENNMDAQTNSKPAQANSMSRTVIAGMTLLIFGLVFFLLSIFFGDHLYFGETFGELLSSTIVLTSLCLLFIHDFRILSVCATTLFIYCIICFGFLDISSIANYLFTFLSSVIIVVWFIICGEHANKEAVFQNTALTINDPKDTNDGNYN